MKKAVHRTPGTEVEGATTALIKARKAYVTAYMEAREALEKCGGIDQLERKLSLSTFEAGERPHFFMAVTAITTEAGFRNPNILVNHDRLVREILEIATHNVRLSFISGLEHLGFSSTQARFYLGRVEERGADRFYQTIERRIPQELQDFRARLAEQAGHTVDTLDKLRPVYDTAATDREEAMRKLISSLTNVELLEFLGAFKRVVDEATIYLEERENWLQL